jgi:DHA1 family tetracycline resistance protein-like MFS transporter
LRARRGLFGPGFLRRGVVVSAPLMAELAAPQAQAPKSERAAFLFIFGALAIDMLALGIISPVLPRLILGMQGGDEASTARWVGWLLTVASVMQFASMTAVGALSDAIGRRPVMLLSMFGQAANYVIIAMAPSLWWLMIGQIIFGITSSSVPTAMAYVSDVTPASDRAAAFGKLSAAFGIGFLVGPSLGGVLGNLDPKAPFWVAGALSALNGLYGLFVLPESLTRARRTAFRLRKINPFSSLVLFRQRKSVRWLAFVKFLNDIAFWSYQASFALYAMYRYHWTPRDIGLTLTLYAALSGAVQILLVGWVVKRFGERTAVVSGLLFGAIGFVLLGLAPTGLWLLIFLPIGVLWGLAGPANQSIMTRRVDATQQGLLQGALASLTGIAGMIGPGLFTVVFATFIGREAHLHQPGAPFLTAALLVGASAAVAFFATRGGDAHTLVHPEP